MISTEDTWNLYLATRLHYLHNYDAVKYKGKLLQAQKTRPDKVLVKTCLTELKDKREIIEFCMANFLYENDNFLYENQDDATNFFFRWKKYWNSVDYMIQGDLSHIEIQMYKNNCSLEKYITEYSYSDILSNKIHRESLCVILNKMTIPKMEGFGAKKLKTRVEKTLPLISGRLKKISSEILKF